MSICFSFIPPLLFLRGLYMLCHSAVAELVSRLLLYRSMLRLKHERDTGSDDVSGQKKRIKKQDGSSASASSSSSSVCTVVPLDDDDKTQVVTQAATKVCTALVAVRPPPSHRTQRIAKHIAKVGWPNFPIEDTMNMSRFALLYKAYFLLDDRKALYDCLSMSAEHAGSFIGFFYRESSIRECASEGCGFAGCRLHEVWLAVLESRICNASTLKRFIGAVVSFKWPIPEYVWAKNAGATGYRGVSTFALALQYEYSVDDLADLRSKGAVIPRDPEGIARFAVCAEWNYPSSLFLGVISYLAIPIYAAFSEGDIWPFLYFDFCTCVSHACINFLIEEPQSETSTEATNRASSSLQYIFGVVHDHVDVIVEEDGTEQLTNSRDTDQRAKTLLEVTTAAGLGLLYALEVVYDSWREDRVLPKDLLSVVIAYLTAPSFRPLQELIPTTIKWTNQAAPRWFRDTMQQTETVCAVESATAARASGQIRDWAAFDASVFHRRPAVASAPEGVAVSAPPSDTEKNNSKPPTVV